MEVKIIFVSYSRENIRRAHIIAKRYGFDPLFVRYLAGTNVENIVREISLSPSAKWVVISPPYYVSPFDSKGLQCLHVQLEMNEYDLIVTLDNAPPENGTTGVFFSPKHQVDCFKRIEKLGFNKYGAQLFQYQKREELRSVVEAAANTGIRYMIGAGFDGPDLAEEFGLQFIGTFISETSINSAFREAKSLIAFGRRGYTESDTLRALLRYTRDGVIAVDQNDVIYAFNGVAEEVFGIPPEEIIGKKIGDSRFRGVLRDMLAVTGKQTEKVYRLRNVSIISDHLPINTQEGINGSLILFQKMSKKLAEEHRQRHENFKKGLIAKARFSDLVSVSAQMKKVSATAKRYAGTEVPVLIRGEFGTETELLAQCIHNAQENHALKPFLTVHCDSLGTDYLRCGFFAQTTNSFDKQRPSPTFFEIANGGTMFLRGVEHLFPEQQAGIYSVLEEASLYSSTQESVIPICVRIIASTSCNLHELLEKNLFHAGLYYMLSVFPLEIPPLRERREDIPVLIMQSMRFAFQKCHKTPPALSDKLLAALSNLDWPGNLQEIVNLSEACAALSKEEGDAKAFLIKHIAKARRKTLCGEMSDILDYSKPVPKIDEIKLEAVRKLAATPGLSKKRIADQLGISRPTLDKLLKNL